MFDKYKLFGFEIIITIVLFDYKQIGIKVFATVFKYFTTSLLYLFNKNISRTCQFCESNYVDIIQSKLNDSGTKRNMILLA